MMRLRDLLMVDISLITTSPIPLIIRISVLVLGIDWTKDTDDYINLHVTDFTPTQGEVDLKNQFSGGVIIDYDKIPIDYIFTVKVPKSEITTTASYLEVDDLSHGSSMKLIDRVICARVEIRINEDPSLLRVGTLVFLEKIETGDLGSSKGQKLVKNIRKHVPHLANKLPKKRKLDSLLFKPSKIPTGESLAFHNYGDNETQAYLSKNIGFEDVMDEKDSSDEEIDRSTTDASRILSQPKELRFTSPFSKPQLSQSSDNLIPDSQEIPDSQHISDAQKKSSPNFESKEAMNSQSSQKGPLNSQNSQKEPLRHPPTSLEKNSLEKHSLEGISLDKSILSASSNVAKKTIFDDYVVNVITLQKLLKVPDTLEIINKRHIFQVKGKLRMTEPWDNFMIKPFKRTFKLSNFKLFLIDNDKYLQIEFSDAELCKFFKITEFEEFLVNYQPIIENLQLLLKHRFTVKVSKRVREFNGFKNSYWTCTNNIFELTSQI